MTASASCLVRCAGCKVILRVGPGQTEFVCPTCQLPQMLPPELMRKQKAHGIDPTKIQLPCVNCKSILNVPYGLSRFNCPQCGLHLATAPPPEQLQEVAIGVEHEEDECGLAGETFTDYVNLICKKEESGNIRKTI
ncbi:hypothetical protein LIER_32360 [Lithospermum erythrorhizon]|uniref:Uncharacterized protein n=1 Tax=Lithospermum erythrorhizon TaxID=34254 RepID=A0AAV3RXN3_LITER